MNRREADSRADYDPSELFHEIKNGENIFQVHNHIFSSSSLTLSSLYCTKRINEESFSKVLQQNTDELSKKPSEQGK